jgi:hypothetical protein
MGDATLTRIQATCRLAVGTAFVLAPERAGATWIGDEAKRPGPQVLGAAFGARDAAIGAGVLATAGGDAVRPWLLAGAVSDAVDLVATLRAREALPRQALVSVTAVAAVSTALGVYLAARA